MRIKQNLLMIMAFILVLSPLLAAAGESHKVEAEKVDGKISSKDEVVYATLNANGDLEDIYVVNTLDVAQAGEILDHGTYDSVKNLTDLSELKQEGETVRLEAPEGKFYYQGNMEKNTEMPWDITISYTLDGKNVDPSDLAGKTGHVVINIQTVANENGDKIFFENYLLQVSLLLPNKYGNIEASGGMIANAGKNKQITFTVMPGEEEEFRVEADAEDFEFQGVEIAAVPSTLPIDTSEMTSMTDDMGALSDAIGELNSGVADLKDGVSQLNNGASSLLDGSAQYQKGISQLSGKSSEIVGASKSIAEALQAMSSSLSGDTPEMDVTSLSELPGTLTQLADGLKDTANALSDLQEGYSLAYQTLGNTINGIPTYQLSQEDKDALYASGADTNVLDKLIASHSAAQEVKGVYSNFKTVFDSVGPALSQSSEAIKVVSGTLTSIADGLSKSLEDMDMSGLAELQKGLASLSSQYGEFHAGLVSYTGGVSQLSASYNQLHSGISGLSGGTDELEKGVVELHEGTEELHQETSDLPEQMEAEINEMIQEYDKSDFEPISFVSPKNEKVYSVQFVIKSESIQKADEETEKAEPEKEKGFWDLLLDLFR